MASDRSIWGLGGSSDKKRETQVQGTQALRLVHAFEDSEAGWFWQTDRQGRITYLTEKVAKQLHGRHGPVLGASFVDIFEVDGRSTANQRSLPAYLNTRSPFDDVSVRQVGRGESRWWSIRGRPIIDGFGQFQGFAGSGSDLTEKRRSEAEIARLAMFDVLTGLANRQQIQHNLKQMLIANSNGHRNTALLLLDLDRFKAVNDTLGHQVGDQLLKQVARRLEDVIGDWGMVGRQGGDEFKVILPGEGNPNRIEEMAQRIIKALSAPYFIAGSSISIGCSIGAAIAPEDGSDDETLVRNADLALYAAKAAGRGVHRFFEPSLLAGAQSRKQLEDDLRKALAEDQLHLVYQPVVSTRAVRVVGYEALLRWEHPLRGMIPPVTFIPIAEECGLIEAVGNWVLRTATREAVSWPEDVRVAVNVSPIQFANPQFPTIVASAIAESGIAPARLELEITESIFLNDGDATDRMFKALKGLGVRLALDDFGTGYSSLGYLRNAPFDKIKIDQSFVRGAAQPGNRNAAIIKAIVTLADTLDMETTAEGVEMQDEIELIRSLGCTHIQGYVYGQPVRCSVVMEQLGDGNEAQASGFMKSRAPRLKMLRWARIRCCNLQGDIRIRNLSVSGAMIDGIDIPKSAVGKLIEIEVVEGDWISGKLLWARGGQAGIAFDEFFNMERLNAQPKSRSIIRRTG